MSDLALSRSSTVLENSYSDATDTVVILIGKGRVGHHIDESMDRNLLLETAELDVIRCYPFAK